METKFTKGNYKAIGLEIRHVNTSMILANVYPHLSTNQSKEEAESNAILFAASSKMYEALQAFIELDNDPHYHGLMPVFLREFRSKAEAALKAASIQ